MACSPLVPLILGGVCLALGIAVFPIYHKVLHNALEKVSHVANNK